MWYVCGMEKGLLSLNNVKIIILLKCKTKLTWGYSRKTGETTELL